MDHSSNAISAAGALFFDAAGRLLLVEPTYKPHWEIPGGVIEHGETPSEACRREIEEELGLVREPGRLLVVDWAPQGDQDRVLFVFEGGLLTADDRIHLQAEELKGYEFVTPDQARQRLIPRLARRVTEALRARESGETRYLEHGISRSNS
ncbi:ADP-ribose pyrophosphatase YjhB, NUDIX family [Lentzea waywayandensis]|uniref:ADP-ribose pyrophosphatase YjhB, NUDIX family n=1 Tax=Lentzea waywayandensis TaxID=84724 RepID=A0A1I6F6N8_9PSEU|nr:NUDIX hydrolase [Lentzea waywayandensis]SFR25437.1 ADP-ribose pyrophosphatase YjhB, NUDIX family [Lentzea waywayandensis]